MSHSPHHTKIELSAALLHVRFKWCEWAMCAALFLTAVSSRVAGQTGTPTPTPTATPNYEPYLFTTVAGLGPGSADGKGSAAQFNSPTGVAVDGNGNAYVADRANYTIRKVSPDGVVTTFAGTAGVGLSSTDGIGAAAKFYSPDDVALDSSGNVYVGDYYAIRKVTPDAVVTTLAGADGIPGNVDGTGDAARFGLAGGVAVDSSGNVYVADAPNNEIRKVTPDGVVTTFAGSSTAGSADGTGAAAQFNTPDGVAVDDADNIYVADRGNNTIRKVTPDGQVTTFAGSVGPTGPIPGFVNGNGAAAQFNNPVGIAVGPDGNVYVSDGSNYAIRKITPTADVTTLAGGQSGTADGTGTAARFGFPSRLKAGANGNLYVADNVNNTIRIVTPDGVVTTLAGANDGPGAVDGSGSAARFNAPQFPALDSNGNVVVGDVLNNTIRRITPTGVVTTVAGSPGLSGSADGTGSAARFNQPRGVAVDASDNIYAVDSGNYTIRKITPDGVVTTLAGSPGLSGSADGMGSAARFNQARGLAIDPAGHLYVGDTNNNTVRKITPDGVVSTFAGAAGQSGSSDGSGTAARFSFPRGVAVDASGNVYVADSGNATIRMITPSGDVTTIAGTAGSMGSGDGTGTAAQFEFPVGLTVDGSGNVFVGDSNANTVRKITPAGMVTTLGGSVDTSGNADGIGSAALFNSPGGVVADNNGNLYIADFYNNTVRRAQAPPAITSPLTGSATVGAPFVYQVTTFGATSVSVSGLPAGLSFNSSLNAIVGTPSDAGNFAVTLTASNSTASNDATLMLAIVPPPASGPLIVSSTSATGRINTPFNFQVITRGGSPGTRVAATGLPPGISIDAMSGLISGATPNAGGFAVTLTVTDGSAQSTAILELTIVSDPMLPVILNPSTTTLTPGQPFSYTINAPTGSSDLSVYDGSYSGSYDGTIVNADGSDGGPVSGSVAFSASNGGVTVTDPGSGTGGIDSSGNVGFGGSGSAGFATYGFEGIFVLASDGSISVSGSWAADFPDGGGASGSWTASRPPVTRRVLALSDSSSDPTTFTLVGTLPTGLSFDPKTGTISGTFMGTAERNGGTPEDKYLNDIITNVQIFATNSHGTGTKPLTFLNAQPGAVNISTRMSVGTGDNVLIAGFIVTGNAPKKVLLRAIGPSLPISSALQHTTLELYQGANLLGYNDGWKNTQQQEIMATGVPPNSDNESAMVATLAPNSYTAIVSGQDNTTGVGLAEVYDLDTASVDVSASSQLANISTRGTVLTGDDVMIGGFIVSGTGSNILVRAIGPSLTGQGVTGALDDPMLELHDGSGGLIVGNDDWRSTQEQQIIATTIPPTDDREAAIVATLQPGNYTAIVRGKNETTGVALVEVYSLQQ